MTWLIPDYAVFYGGELCVTGKKVKIADQDSAEMAKYKECEYILFCGDCCGCRS